MVNPLYAQDILSIKDLSLEQIQLILKTAKHLKQHPASQLHSVSLNPLLAHGCRLSQLSCV